MASDTIVVPTGCRPTKIRMNNEGILVGHPALFTNLVDPGEQSQRGIFLFTWQPEYLHRMAAGDEDNLSVDQLGHMRGLAGINTFF